MPVSVLSIYFLEASVSYAFYILMLRIFPRFAVYAPRRLVLNERHWRSAPQNPKNIRNPLIFLRKMASFSCFTGLKIMLFHASMKRMTF